MRPHSPHVVIDVRMLRHAGIGRYIRGVVPRVIQRQPSWRFTLLGTRDPVDAADWPRRDGVTLKQCRSDIYSVSEQIELAIQTPRSAHMFWSPHYNLPLLQRRPTVVTIHDVGHLALADLYPGRIKQFYARRMLGAVRDRAASVIFNSEFTKGEFARYVGHPQRSDVIYLGVDSAWSARPTAESPHEGPYLLFVGSVKPHKNLAGLLAAYRELGDVDEALVVIGSRAGQRTIDRAAIDLAQSFGDRVKFVDDADDAMLRRYLHHATALVVPSIYEGFGLPAVEAMAAGCPCVVSSAGALPEVCGEAAVYFDPRDPRDAASQIRRVLRDPGLRARLVEEGRRRAAEFDWEQAANATVRVLERTMSLSGAWRAVEQPQHA
jgi:glycosyltransferase involved in cell wall biosynthesis